MKVKDFFISKTNFKDKFSIAHFPYEFFRNTAEKFLPFKSDKTDRLGNSADTKYIRMQEIKWHSTIKWKLERIFSFRNRNFYYIGIIQDHGISLQSMCTDRYYCHSGIRRSQHRSPAGQWITGRTSRRRYNQSIGCVFLNEMIINWKLYPDQLSYFIMADNNIV